MKRLAIIAALLVIVNPFRWEVARQWTMELTVMGGFPFVVFHWEGN